MTYEIKLEGESVLITDVENNSIHYFRIDQWNLSVNTITYFGNVPDKSIPFLQKQFGFTFNDVEILYNAGVQFINSKRE
jgi:hypothetical protein